MYLHQKKLFSLIVKEKINIIYDTFNSTKNFHNNSIKVSIPRASPGREESGCKHLETNCKKQNSTPNDKHHILSIFCMPAEKEEIKFLELKSMYFSAFIFFESSSDLLLFWKSK